MNDIARAVKARNPIEDVVARRGAVRLRRRGRYLMGLCPFHVEKTPSLAVDVRTGRWRCFGRCATRWLDAIDFVGWQRHGAAWNARNPEMFKQALHTLGGELPPLAYALPAAWKAPVDYRPVEMSPDARMLLDRVTALYRVRLWAMGSGPRTPLAYLRSRGFTDEAIRQAGLGYSVGDGLMKYLRHTGVPLELPRGMCLIDRDHGDREFLRGRIVFPDCDESGSVLHLCGRKWAKFLGVNAPKYLSLKGVDKPLYGWGRLHRGPSPRPLFVTESLPDGLTLVQWSLDAVTTLGTALKEAHARLLAALPRPIVYVPHNDGGTGLESARKWRDAVGRGEILELPTSVKDVNDLAIAPAGREAFFDRLLDAGLWPGT